jgi:hypothetical protein
MYKFIFTTTLDYRSLYNAPVMMSRHPELCQYVETVLANAKPLLVQGLAERIVCNVLDHGKLSESYVFEMNKIGRDIDEDTADADSLLYDTEMQLRDLLLRTMALEWQMPQHPDDGRSFRLLVHLRDSSKATGALQSGSWMVATSSEVDANIATGADVLPLRSVVSTGMQFQLYALHQGLGPS